MISEPEYCKILNVCANDQQRNEFVEMNIETAISQLGVPALRGKQREAIDAVLSGKDVVYLFPTGTGKTLVYEAAALCSPNCTVVVSPLIGLLQQQAARAAASDIGVMQAFEESCIRTNSHCNLRLVYTTPEQLSATSTLRCYLKRNNVEVDRIVVDEAHLLVQWETFRCVILCRNHLLLGSIMTTPVHAVPCTRILQVYAAP